MSDFDSNSASGLLAKFSNSKDTKDMLRDGADVAALIVDSFSACGVGYLNTIRSGYTFSVTKKSCAVGYYSFGHEVGHNVGAHHNPEVAKNYYYAFGHGHLISAGDGNEGVRTIMSYSTSGHFYRVNYWSNPNVKYPITQTSTGVSGLSDNARVWQQNRARLAAIGSEETGILECYKLLKLMLNFFLTFIHFSMIGHPTF